MYAKYIKSKDREQCITILSELTFMKPTEVQAIIKEEELKVKRENLQRVRVMTIISELYCDLAELSDILGYLRIRGCYDDKSAQYYRRVEEDMGRIRTKLPDITKEIIEEAIKAGKTPKECFNADNLGLEKSQFQSAWYRIKKTLADKGEDIPSRMVDEEILDLIREQIDTGVSKEQSYEQLRKGISQTRFERLWKQAENDSLVADMRRLISRKFNKAQVYDRYKARLSKGLFEKLWDRAVQDTSSPSEAVGDSKVKTHNQGVSSPDSKESSEDNKVEALAQKEGAGRRSAVSSALGLKKRRIGMSEVISKLKVIHETMGSLLKELEESEYE